MIGPFLHGETFPNVQSEPAGTQLYSISLCPIAAHQRESSTSPSTALPEEIAGCDKVTPQSSFLQAVPTSVTACKSWP